MSGRGTYIRHGKGRWRGPRQLLGNLQTHRRNVSFEGGVGVRVGRHPVLCLWKRISRPIVVGESQRRWRSAPQQTPALTTTCARSPTFLGHSSRPHLFTAHRVHLWQQSQPHPILRETDTLLADALRRGRSVIHNAIQVANLGHVGSPKLALQCTLALVILNKYSKIHLEKTAARALPQCDIRILDTKSFTVCSRPTMHSNPFRN